VLFRSGKATLRSRAVVSDGQMELDGLTSERALDVPGEKGNPSRRNRSRKSRSRSKTAGASPDLNAIWNELMSMKSIVEDEHDRKLRRIESDLRWTMTLVGGQFLTIIGAAIAMLAGV
jgi:hypothetical protein